jgi:hypothetical protein
MADQLASLAFMDLILENARLVSENNRHKLAELARRSMLPPDVIKKLQAAGFQIPLPNSSPDQN